MKQTRHHYLKPLFLFLILSLLWIIVFLFIIVNLFHETDRLRVYLIFNSLAFLIVSSYLLYFFLRKLDLSQKVQLESNSNPDERYRIVADAASDAIVTVDENNIIKYANPAVYSIFKYTPEELLEEDLNIIVPDNLQQEGINKFWENKLKGSNSTTIELTGKDKDGNEFQLENSMGIVQVDGAAHFIIIMRDISERKEIEKQLESNEKKFRSLIENSTDAFILTDDRGVIQYASPSIEKVLGYKPQELKEVNTLKLFKRTELYGLRRDLLALMLKPGSKLNGRFNVKGKDGEWHVLQGVATNMLSNNLVNAVVVNFRDVTEQMKAEEVIKESEERFRMMADSSPVLIWVSGEDKKCSYFNKVWLDFTGHSIEEELEINTIDRVHPDDYENCFNHYSECFDKREVFRLEYRLLRHDGEYRWVYDTGIPRFTPSGKFEGYIGSCVDITELKELQKQVEDSELKYKNLFRKNPQPMLLINTGNLTLADINDSASRKFGISSFATDVKVTDVVHEDDAALFLGWVRSGLKEQELLMQMKGADNKIIHAEVSMKPLQMDNEDHYLMLIHDVTEKWLFDEAIKNIASGISAATGKGFFNSLSLFLSKILSMEHVVIGRFVSTEKVESLSFFSKLEIKNDRTFSLSNSPFNKDNGLHDVDFAPINPDYYNNDELISNFKPAYYGGRLLTDSDGAITGIVICMGETPPPSEKLAEFVLEIFAVRAAAEIERLKAEDDAFKREQEFKTLAENSKDLIVRFDQNFRHMYINPAIYESSGLKPEVFIGKTSREVGMPPEMCDQWEKSIGETFDTGEIQTSTFIFQTPTKTTHFFAQLVPEKDKDGNIISVLSTVRDITALKVNENLMKDLNVELEERAKQLSDSNAELEQFAYVASHDLQEPLRTISSFSQLLERRYKNKLDKDADEFLEFIVEAASRMQVLINNLLAYSRITTRGSEFKPVKLNEVLRKTLSNLNASIKDKNAEVIVEELPEVLADESQMVQLFQNLLGNALKFTDKEKPIVTVSATERELDWVITVKDNGIGIDEKYHSRIFQVFQRLHTREDFEGTGIGLAISKKIVERHGGDIWVESELGAGAAFSFSIDK